MKGSGKSGKMGGKDNVVKGYERNTEKGSKERVRDNTSPKHRQIITNKSPTHHQSINLKLKLRTFRSEFHKRSFGVGLALEADPCMTSVHDNLQLKY